jgi:protein AbiQ
MNTSYAEVFLFKKGVFGDAEMQLKKLDLSFYEANTGLVEALDNVYGHWIAGKTRGYGVVIINLKNLTFAIPLRSNISHNAAYLTVNNTNKGIRKGLDFSKALLIRDNRYISNERYKIPAEEHKKLQGKEHFIIGKFEKYVEKYINAVSKSDKNILHSQEYRFTTLKNYHSEFDL